MPHCTLAVGLDTENMTEALTACLQKWAVVAGMAEAIGVLVPPSAQDVHEALLSDRTKQ